MKFYDQEGDRDVTLVQLADALRPLLQPTDARLLAADKRREVAERALADAQQAAEHWATMYRTAAAERDDANATAGRLAYTIAGMEQEIAALRAERDTYRAQADAQRQAATEAAQRADATQARWAALHSSRPAYQD